MEADSSSGQTIPERDDGVRALRILHHRRHRALPTVPVRCAMHSHRTRRTRVRLRGDGAGVPFPRRVAVPALDHEGVTHPGNGASDVAGVPHFLRKCGRDARVPRIERPAPRVLTRRRRRYFHSRARTGGRGCLGVQTEMTKKRTCGTTPEISPSGGDVRPGARRVRARGGARLLLALLAAGALLSGCGGGGGTVAPASDPTPPPQQPTPPPDSGSRSPSCSGSRLRLPLPLLTPTPAPPPAPPPPSEPCEVGEVGTTVGCLSAAVYRERRDAIANKHSNEELFRRPVRGW